MPASSKRAGDPLNPERLHQIDYSFVSSRVLTTGVQLAVFSHIADGNKTVREIARAANSSQRGMRMLLDALVALELLIKKNAQYGLAPLAAKFLVRGAPEYLGEVMEHDWLWDVWSQLPKAVRTGQPAQRVTSRKRAKQFFPILIRTLHVLHRRRAESASKVLGSKHSLSALKIVDVACGSGVWSIAFAEADPQAHITAQDFPEILPETRKYINRHGVEGQFDYLPGDLNEVDFGKERYDMALVGNIVHAAGERSSRQLFRRLYRALRSGGSIVIADMIPNDERTGPPFAVFFALNMLLNTDVGDTYTLAEYTQWLKKAGFARVETADIGSHSPLIIGWKK